MYSLCACPTYQEVTHKLCETLSMVANIGVTHPEYVMIARGNNRVSNSSSTSSSDHGRSGHRPEPVDKGTPLSSSADEEERPRKSDAGTEVSAELSAGRKGGVAGEGEGEEEEEERKKKKEESQNNDVRKTQKKEDMEKDSSASEELLQPTIQALAVLSNVSNFELYLTKCLM